MNSNDIDLVLQKIHEDLEKLESARKQVLDVTSAGIDITKVIIDLTEKIGLVYTVLDEGGESYKAGISDNLNKLNDHVVDLRHASDESIAAFALRLENFTSSLSSSLETSVASITSKATDIFQNQNNVIQRNLLDLEHLHSKILSLKDNVSEIDFKGQLRFVNENIERYSTTTTDKIEDATKVMQQYFDKRITANQTSVAQDNLLLHQETKDIGNQLAASIQTLVQKNNEETSAKFQQKIAELENQAKINSYITWFIVIIAAVAQIIL